MQDSGYMWLVKPFEKSNILCKNQFYFNGNTILKKQKGRIF